MGGWRPESVNNNPNKNQWFRSDVGADEKGKGKEMMLNTDLCLVFMGNSGGPLKAGSESCCAWRMDSDYVQPSFMPGNNWYKYDDEFCGTPPEWLLTDPGSGFGQQRSDCCTGQGTGFFSDCGDPWLVQGSAWDAMKTFSLDENEWLKTFQVSWRKATENGFKNLKSLSGGSSPRPSPSPSPRRRRSWGWR